LFGEVSGLATAIHQIIVGVLLVLHFFPQRGKAIEKQLAKVGQGDGVAASDAFSGKLFDEIAEEEIHGVGGGEVYDLAEKLGSKGFGIGDGILRFALGKMVRAKRGTFLSIRGTMILVNQHVATLAARILVLTLGFGVVFGGHGFAFRVWK
jgi:hypothetical protein